MVNWEDKIWLEGRWRFGVICPRCCLKRYLPNYHAKDASYCFRCSGAEKGRGWHLANPSGPERRMIRTLTSMKIPFEREVPLLWYNIDFVINSTHAIEVDGGTIHTDLRIHDPIRSVIRLDHIRERYKLLVLTDSQTKNCKRALQEYLQS